MKLLLVTMSLLISIHISAQRVCDTLHPKLLSNSGQCKWGFIKLNTLTKGIVIEHNKASGSCGVRAFASLSIIKINNDTIRVLDMCNQNLYTTGQKVQIIPADEPGFQVDIPYYCFIDGQKVIRKKEKKNHQSEDKFIAHSNNFDNTIFKTTWGQLSIAP